MDGAATPQAPERWRRDPCARAHERQHCRSSPDARVPDLDDAVPGTSCEPRRMVGWLDGACRFVQRECLLREFGRVGESRRPLLGWPCRVDRSYSIIRVVSEDGPAIVALRTGISLGARWPELGLAGLRGRREVACGVCIHHSFLLLGMNVRCWDVTGRFDGTGCPHTISPPLLDQHPDKK
jgi:hypothetical protein